MSARRQRKKKASLVASEDSDEMDMETILKRSMRMLTKNLLERSAQQPAPQPAPQPTQQAARASEDISTLKEAVKTLEKNQESSNALLGKIWEKMQSGGA